MKKIIFILTSLQDPHALKRIQEFAEKGSNFEVYGFSRNIGFGSQISVPYTELGKMTNGTGYLSRLKFLGPVLRKLVQKYKNDDVVFFCFGLEIAFFIRLFSSKPYFYEECDLMYTYLKFPLSLLEPIFKFIDRRLVASSHESIFTSEGFVEYLYGDKVPKNLSVIANRLSNSILNMGWNNLPPKQVDIKKLRIGFNGSLCDKSVLRFAFTVAKNFPEISLTFNGTIQKFDDEYTKVLESLQMLPNVKFTGKFKNPDDLFKLHEDMDLLLCTYNTTFENVRRAEPNKLYEAIFFRTPIIVSSDTFLAKKVNKLNIGFEVDADTPEKVKEFINNLTSEIIETKSKACAEIPLSYCINNNDSFFQKINIFKE